MGTPGIPHHPLALSLLDLARRQSHVAVRVGARHVVLRRGAVTSITPSDGDISLEEFLVQANRVSPAQLAEGRQAGGPGSAADACVRLGHLTEKALRDCRRALWIDRLVQTLASGAEHAVEAPPPDGDPTAPRTAAVPLILDALERLAAQGAAEAVGTRAAHRLVWEDVPDVEAARRWSEVDGQSGASVGEVLGTSPAAASRLAALLRAGFVRLEGPAEVPPPAPRRPSLIPPAGVERTSDPHVSLPPPREPVLRLDPGEAPGVEAPDDLAEPLWKPPAATARLEDPLVPLEDEVRRLEEAGAPGPERSRAWKALARAWQREYGALEEAARAWREASSADPTDGTALDQAALLCAATGRTSLAVAYARAAVGAAPKGPERGRALRRLAETCLRDGDVTRAAEALAQAIDTDPNRADDAEWLARLRHQAGDMNGAVTWARRAAAHLRARRPGRARALLAWATTLGPDDITVLTEYAGTLAADGYPEAAVSLLSEAARTSSDPDQRRALLLEAAEHAEGVGRPDLAAERLMEAFAADPHADALHEPLVADLEAAGQLALQAVVTEEVAEVALAEQRPTWLVRAAEAHGRLPGGGDWAEELLARALVMDPGHAEVRRALAARAEQEGDPAVLADALERAAGRAMLEGQPEALALLEDLAGLAEGQLGSTGRALWAWECVQGLDPAHPRAAEEAQRLRSLVEVSREWIATAEQDLERASPAERPNLARRLAGELRDHPDETVRAAALYREALTADASDDVAASSFERLLRRRGDTGGLVELLRLRAEAASSPAERLRHLSLLAALEWGRGHFRASADLCRRVLDLDPQHAVAMARLARCGHRLDDPEVTHEAAQAMARAGRDERAQARALTTLAMQLEGRGEIDGAIEAAQRAVALDPRSTDAVALLLRHVAWLTPEDALSGVEAARQAMGDSPPLLNLATQVAERAGRRDVAGAYLDAWAAIVPSDPRVVRWRLSHAIGEDDVTSLVARTEEALAPDVLDDQTSAIVRRALARVEQLGAVAEAARLALLATDRLGDREPALLDLALRLAEASGRVGPRVAALERCLAHAEGEGRRPPFHALAALHREEQNRAAEVRTLLRLLADDPGDTEALQRLSELFAETGEGERLMAVLALRRDGARSEAERRAALLDLASAAAQVGGDVDQAEAFLRELVDAAGEEAREAALLGAAGALVTLGHPERAVTLLMAQARQGPAPTAGRLCERAIAIAERAAQDPGLALGTAVEALSLAPQEGSLLMAFERLALQVGDVGTAQRVYDDLAEQAMGPHGRRALRYRQARWLERAGDAPAALAAYAEAFSLQPGAGVIFSAIERLALALDDRRPLVEASLAVARRTPDIDQRVALTRRAAELLESLGDVGPAFEVLETAWSETGRMVLLEPLRSLAEQWRAADAEAAASARGRLVDRLTGWAEQTWDGAAKVDLLLHAARIHAEDGGDVESAAALVAEIAGLAEDEDVPRDDIAGALCALAEWHTRAGDGAKAQDALTRAREIAPDHARASELLAQAGAPPTGAPAPDADDANRAAPAAASPPSTTLPLDEAEQLGCALASDPERPRDAVEVLLGVLRRDPSRVRALRVLHDLARAQGTTALGDVLCAILSMFDAGLTPQDETSLMGLGRHLPDVGVTVRGDGEAPGLRALGLLWQHGSNLFRRRTSDYGLMGTDRISDLGLRPLSRAFATATELLAPGEVHLFAHDTGQNTIQVVSTVPPTLVAPLGAEADEATLAFRLGRAVELARPTHLLLAVLEPADRQCVVESLTAAFGPPDGARDVSRQAVELASELWNTIPPKAQSELRDLVHACGGALDADALFADAQRAAVRAGLVVAGGVIASVAGLLWDEPTLAQAAPDTEAGYVAACRASAPLVELLRFALSDAYLAARGQLGTG
jgi:tetratricopeptide (TPR) repeat protein